MMWKGRDDSLGTSRCVRGVIHLVAGSSVMRAQITSCLSSVPADLSFVASLVEVERAEADSAIES